MCLFSNEISTGGMLYSKEKDSVKLHGIFYCLCCLFRCYSVCHIHFRSSLPGQVFVETKKPFGSMDSDDPWPDYSQLIPATFIHHFWEDDVDHAFGQPHSRHAFLPVLPLDSCSLGHSIDV